MPALRVLLVDDHEDFAAAANSLLTHGGFDIVGVAASGEEALEMCQTLQPELLLLDIHLPGLSGVDVANELSHTRHRPQVILISSDTDAASDPDVQAAPVRGFLSKRDLTCTAIDALLR